MEKALQYFENLTKQGSIQKTGNDVFTIEEVKVGLKIFQDEKQESDKVWINTNTVLFDTVNELRDENKSLLVQIRKLTSDKDELLFLSKKVEAMLDAWETQDQQSFNKYINIDTHILLQKIMKQNKQ